MIPGNSGILTLTKYSGGAVLETPSAMTPKGLTSMHTNDTPTTTEDAIPYGYCRCGCGQKTKLAPQTNTKAGWVRGEPMPFMRGHRRTHRIVTVLCAQCATPTQKRADSVEKYTNSFCSPACAHEYRRIDSEAKRETNRAIQKRWREKNRDRHNEKSREWAARNHNKIIDTQQRRRAVAGSRDYKGTIREWMIDQYGERCICCGATDRIEVDHIIPLSKGGEHSTENVQPLCRSCNASKNSQAIDYRDPQGKGCILVTITEADHG